MDDEQLTTEEGGIPSLETLAQMLFERRQEEFICPANWDEASTEWKDVYYSAAAGALDIFRPLIAGNCAAGPWVKVAFSEQPRGPERALFHVASGQRDWVSYGSPHEVAPPGTGLVIKARADVNSMLLLDLESGKD